MNNIITEHTGRVELQTPAQYPQAAPERVLHRIALLACMGLFIIFSVLYSFSIPLFEPQDEEGHLRYINHYANSVKLPDYRDLRDLQSAGYQSHQPPLYYLIHGLLLRSIGQSPLELQFAPNPLRSPAAPALYFHNAPEEKFPFAGRFRLIHFLRLTNALVGALTLLVIYRILRLMFPPQSPWPICATAFVTFIPQFIYICGTLNNDALAVLFASLCLLFLMKFMLSKDAPVKYALLMALFLSLALLSKQLTLFLAPVCCMAVATMKGNLRQKIRNSLVLSVTLAALVGWYYIRNYVLFNDMFLRRVQANELFPNLVQRKTFTQFLSFFSDYFLQHFIKSFWGSFGYMTVWMSWNMYLLYSLTAGVGLAAFAAGLTDAEFRSRLSGKKSALALSAAATVILMAQILGANFQYSQPQGRWAMAALGILAVFWALGMERLFNGPRTRGVAVCFMLTALFLLMNLHVARHTVMGAFPTAPEVIDVMQNQYQMNSGDLEKGAVVGQSFHSGIKDMDYVAVKLTTFGRYNNCSIVFHLRETTNPKQDIVTIRLPAVNMKNDAFHFFRFEPQVNSRGKEYVFLIESPDGEKGNAVGCYYTLGDAYANGHGFVNGRPVLGDMTFVTGRF